jgi:hypothetical protein
MNKWTEEEIELLKTSYRTESKPALLELLPKRSVSSIITKARGLGVQASPYKVHTPPLPPPPLSEVQLGYLAGIIDGEGCIHLSARRKRVYFCHKRGKTYRGECSPYPSIQITNTNLIVLERIQEWLNGWGHIRKFVSKDGRKPRFTLAIDSARQVETILTAILPYLIIKNPQARLILHYIRRYCSGDLSTEEESSIVNTIRALNLKGYKSEE